MRVTLAEVPLDLTELITRRVKELAQTKKELLPWVLEDTSPENLRDHRILNSIIAETLDDPDVNIKFIELQMEVVNAGRIRLKDVHSGAHGEAEVEERRLLEVAYDDLQRKLDDQRGADAQRTRRNDEQLAGRRSTASENATVRSCAASSTQHNQARRPSRRRHNKADFIFAMYRKDTDLIGHGGMTLANQKRVETAAAKAWDTADGDNCAKADAVKKAIRAISDEICRAVAEEPVLGVYGHTGGIHP